MCVDAEESSSSLCISIVEASRAKLPAHDLELAVVIFALKIWRH